MEQWRDPADPEVFMDVHQGRRAVEQLREADFTEFRLDGWMVLYHQGVVEFERQYRGFANFILNPGGLARPMYDKLIRVGALDRTTVQSGREELDAWHASPFALYQQGMFLAAARVG
jgi:hypothetical protein